MFAVRYAPSVQNILHARDEGLEIRFVYQEKLNGRYEDKTLVGIPADVRLRSQSDEGTFLVYLKSRGDELLVTFDAVSKQVSVTPISSPEWDRLMKQRTPLS